MKVKKINIFVIIIAVCVTAFSEIPNNENYQKIEFNTGWSFGASYLIQERTVSNYRLSQFFHVKKNSWFPFDMEVFPLTIAFQNNKVSYANLLIIPVALGVAYISNTKNPFFNYPFMVTAAPQLFGNFRVHLLSIKKILHFYIGETTDYYIYGKKSAIYTESIVGCKLALGNLRTRIDLSKPWLNGYLKKQKFGINAVIGFSMGGTN